jgi:F0F1-type ATP synthase membrane subunit a
MDKMAEVLQEQLANTTVFTIPLFGGIKVSESIVITWVVMAILLFLSLWLTHDLKVFNPGKRQLIAESFVTWLEKILSADMLGDKGKAVLAVSGVRAAVCHRTCQHDRDLRHEAADQGYERHAARWPS